MTEVSPKVMALAQKIQADREKKEAKMREDITNRYPHALPDTLTFDESAKKYKVRIKCVETGNTDRWVFTSDLHQINTSVEVSEQRKAAKRSEKAAELKAARKLLAERKLEAQQ